MKANPLIVAGVVLLGGLLLALRNQVQITSARGNLAAAESQLAALGEQERSIERGIASLEAEFREQQRAAASASVAAAAEQRELAKADPESAWAEPPPVLPEWNPDSPYVWVGKELLPNLPMEPFTEEGIDPGVAAILGLKEEEWRELSKKLRQSLAEFRELETAHVQTTTNHLAGIYDGEKQTIIIQPLPEEGARLKEEFFGAVQSALGEQRAGLLQTVGRSWLGEQFSRFGEAEKTISAVRHPDGRFNVSIQSGGGWQSIGTSRAEDFQRYIPPHLLHHFEHLMKAPEDGQDLHSAQAHLTQ